MDVEGYSWNYETTRIPEMLGRFYKYFLNKMKTKILSNRMSQNFIHNRTETITNV